MLYFRFLVDDLEKRLTLTETGLEGVNLLLSDFKREGTQFWVVWIHSFIDQFSYLYNDQTLEIKCSRFIHQPYWHKITFTYIAAQSNRAFNATMVAMNSTIQRLNEAFQLLSATGISLSKNTSYLKSIFNCDWMIPPNAHHLIF